MKQCPQCKSTYTDDTLSFCLSDGTPLVVYLEDNEKTQEMTFADKNALQIGISSKEKDTEVIPEARLTESTISNQTAENKRNVSPILTSLILSLLFIVIVGFGGFLAYKYFVKEEIATNGNNSQNDDIADLKGEIANLKKQINKTENLNSNESISNSKADQKENVARVNSPKDGFLALRSLPNHKTGKLIVKIPHGENVKIITCQSKSVKIAGKSGRWCKTSYKGTEGWVFDVWLRR